MTTSQNSSTETITGENGVFEKSFKITLSWVWIDYFALEDTSGHDPQNLLQLSFKTDADVTDMEIFVDNIVITG